MLWVYWTAIVLVLALHIWVAYHGVLKTDSDADVFKQAALMKIKNGRFSAPTATGYLPHSEEVFGVYPGYPALLSAWLSIAGPSHSASIAFDLGLNFIASLIASMWLLRKCGNGPLAAACLLFLQFLVNCKLGRPEVLASATFMLALYINTAWPSSAWWASALPLGVAVASSYAVGAACFAAYSLFTALQTNRPAKVIPRLTCTAGLTAVVAAGVWLYVVYPNPRLAISDFLGLVHNVRSRTSLTGQLTALWNEHFVVAAPLLAAILVTAIGARPATARTRIIDPATLRSITAALAGALAYLLVLAALSKLPAYYLPPLYHFLTPMAICGLWHTAYIRTVLMRNRACIAAIVAIPAILIARYNWFLIRAAIVPIGWPPDAVTPAIARATVESIVPETVSLGGDGALITVLGTKYKFLSLNWTGDNWPDYIVSTIDSRSLKPWLLERRGSGGGWERIAERIEREYESVETGLGPPKPCWLSEWLRRHELPNPRYKNCDWYIVMWRRRGQGE